jgi:hypothetical protein
MTLMSLQYATNHMRLLQAKLHQYKVVVCMPYNRDVTHPQYVWDETGKKVVKVMRGKRGMLNAVLFTFIRAHLSPPSPPLAPLDHNLK